MEQPKSDARDGNLYARSKCQWRQRRKNVTAAAIPALLGNTCHRAGTRLEPMAVPHPRQPMQITKYVRGLAVATAVSAMGPMAETAVSK